MTGNRAATTTMMIMEITGTMIITTTPGGTRTVTTRVCLDGSMRTRTMTTGSLSIGGRGKEVGRIGSKVPTRSRRNPKDGDGDGDRARRGTRNPVCGLIGSTETRTRTLAKTRWSKRGRESLCPVVLVLHAT